MKNTKIIISHIDEIYFLLCIITHREKNIVKSNPSGRKSKKKLPMGEKKLSEFKGESIKKIISYRAIPRVGLIKSKKLN